MKMYITHDMVIRYILYVLRQQFAEQGKLNIEYGMFLKNPDNEDSPREASIIRIDNYGVIYYDPLKRETFYQGEFPGSVFFEQNNFSLKRGFHSVYAPSISENLIEVFESKASKMLNYSHELEIQLFGNN